MGHKYSRQRGQEPGMSEDLKRPVQLKGASERVVGDKVFNVGKGLVMRALCTR